MVAGEKPLAKPFVSREGRRALATAAPADAVEILPPLVDGVGGARESDVAAKKPVEVRALRRLAS